MTLAEARVACDTLRNQIRNSGVVPEKFGQTETLDNLYRKLEKHHFPHMKKGTVRHYEMSYRRYVKPRFGKLDPAEITRPMVLDLIADLLEEDGKVNSNKALMILNLIYNKNIEFQFYTGVNPAAGIQRYTRDERERYLTADEIDILLGEIEHQPDEEFGRFIKLCLFTGQRSNNVASMKWNQINLETKTWTIPANEMKSGRLMVVRLTDTALIIIKENPKDRTYVLHNEDAYKQLERWRARWDRFRTKIQMEDVNIHDLRRTFGAILAQNQFSLHSIAAALGQTSISATSIYARLSEQSMMDAFEKVEAVIKKCDKTS